LPKLPVPDLELTLEKYLRCIKPIISSENYRKTELIVKEFLSPNGNGSKLQKILIEKYQDVDNWVNKINITLILFLHVKL
jgi:hypothetical protein